MTPALPLLLLAHSAFAGSFVEKHFTAFEFSADGRYFVGASVDPISTEGGSIRVWDLDAQRLVFERDERAVELVLAPDRPTMFVVTARDDLSSLTIDGAFSVDFTTDLVMERELEPFVGYGSDGVEFSRTDGAEPGTMVLSDGTRSIEMPAFRRMTWSPHTRSFWYAYDKHVYRADPATGEELEVYKQRKLGQRSIGVDGRLMVLEEAGKLLDLASGEVRSLPEGAQWPNVTLPGSESVMVIYDHGERIVFYDAVTMAVRRELTPDSRVSCRAYHLDTPAAYFPCAWHEGRGLLASHAGEDGVRLTDTTTGQTAGHLDAGVLVAWEQAQRTERAEALLQAQNEEHQAIHAAAAAHNAAMADPHSRPTRRWEVEVDINDGGCRSLGVSVPMEWTDRQAMDALVRRLKVEHGTHWSTVTVVPPERRFVNDCEGDWTDLDLRRGANDDD